MPQRKSVTKVSVCALAEMISASINLSGKESTKNSKHADKVPYFFKNTAYLEVLSKLKNYGRKHHADQAQPW